MTSRGAATSPAAVDHEERRAVEIEPAFAEIAEQRFAHPGILRGALAKREHVFVPVDRERFQGVGVQWIATGRVREARQHELGAVDTPHAEAGHEDTSAAERDFPRDLPVAIGATLGIGHGRRPAELRPVHFHHVQQHLLPRFQTEAEERRARIGEHGEQRQGELHGGEASASPVTGLVRVFFIGGFLPWLW